MSSTFLDLKEERAAVVSALLQMEAFPAGMELFPAADEEAWSLITRVIDSSDYYLLVIGGKYGSIDPNTELSYTEKEYDYAVDRGKPVMAFLHADPDSIALGRSEKDQLAREKLVRFREKVEGKKHVKYWDGSGDLQGKVALSFSDFRQRYPAVGWIRGDAEASAEALGELNDLRKLVSRLERQLVSARSGPPQGAEKLSQGDDEAEFTFEYTASAVLEGEEAWQAPTIQGTISRSLTWDEIFSRVGPDMLDEASERALRQRIAALSADFFSPDIDEAVRGWGDSEGRVVERVTRIRSRMSADDFGTVIIQCRALGLIEKSERNRSVKDTQTYWKLTPYGDEHLTALRAIRREDVAEPEAEVGVTS